MERIELDRHDVLYMLEKDGRFLAQATLKVLEVEFALVQSHATFKIWKNDGVRCEVLREGGEWTEGTVYIRAVVDFIPDKPEPEVEDGDKSVLDDLRQKLIDTEV